MPTLTRTKLLISVFTKSDKKMTDVHEVMKKLTDIFHVHFQVASNDLLNYHDDIEKAIDRYRKCRKKRCELGFNSANELCQLLFSHATTGKCCNIILSLVQPNKSELVRFIDHLKVIFGAYEIKDIRVLDLCKQAQPTILAPNDIAPSVNLGITGTEWYVYLSPDRWQAEYSEATMLSAPTLPTLTADNYVEWFSYADPAVFDPIKAKEIFVYLGKHRKNPPYFRAKLI